MVKSAMHICYLHDFNSSSLSHKAQVLHAALHQRGLGTQFIAPDLPHRPAQAMALMESLLAQMTDKPCLVGSSLGGYYATYLAEKHGLKAVLINPAVAPYRLLAPYLGSQQNLYTGERYELTRQHMTELEALEVTQLHPERYSLLVQTGDEILDYREAVTRYTGAQQHVIPGGDHGFQQFENYLDGILEFAGMPLKVTGNALPR